MKKLFLITIVTAFIACTPKSHLEIEPIYSSGMILQQGAEITIAGTADPGTRVDLETDWNFTASCIATPEGTWQMTFSALTADMQAHQIQISTPDSVAIFDDILFGEVWLAGGQSNMEMPLQGWGNDTIMNSKEVIENATDDMLRIFTVERNSTLSATNEIHGQWQKAGEKCTKNFSATAYFFAKNLRDSLNVPVGVVVSCWGGTPIEAWIDENTLSKDSDYVNIIEENRSLSEELEIYAEQIKDVPYDVINRDLPDAYLPFATGEEMIANPDFDRSTWNDILLPDYFENTSTGPIDGVVWFAKDVEIPLAWKNDHLELHLGQIDDRDQTFVNGVEVGRHDDDHSYNIDRVYTIDNEIIKDNVLRIVVRLTDNGGNGGFYVDQDAMRIQNVTRKKQISLEGLWKYCVSMEFTNGRAYHFATKNNQYDKLVRPSRRLDLNIPTALYTGMIEPLKFYTFGGAIWYQGEANVGRSTQYVRLTGALIKSWRGTFNNNFTFLACQIAPYCYEDPDTINAATLREAQRRGINDVKNAGIISTLDIGSCATIHPSNKQEVGRRLAVKALKMVYNKNVIDGGPELAEISVVSNLLVATFSNAEGMYIDPSKRNEFEVAGDDRVFYPASAIVSGNQITFFSKEVLNPVYLRYGWRNCSEASLFNGVGLPALSFSTIDVLDD